MDSTQTMKVIVSTWSMTNNVLCGAHATMVIVDGALAMMVNALCSTCATMVIMDGTLVMVNCLCTLAMAGCCTNIFM